MTKSEIISKTWKDLCAHRGVAPSEVAEEGDLFAALSELLPEGDIKTCEDFKHFNVKCCETCHTFFPEEEMYLVDLPDGGKGWICCPVYSKLFPRPQEDESDLRVAMFYWTISGHDIKEFCGYVPPELLEEMIKDGVLGEDGGGTEPTGEE